ncbi:MAG: DNA-3-methyladenine glycosylase I [Sedimenticola sp.]|nr:MAG: DNA-3-methyladenine glycosylase I [Sedimenticola sp.]
MQRCAWADQSEAETAYHDAEWGVPLHDDQRLFEFLILEGAQAGLSWSTILQKREGYRQAFDNFAAEKIARYSSRKIEQLLLNPAIVRNRLKVNAAVVNARLFLEVQQAHGSFDAYIWSFVGGEPLQNCWESISQVPTETAESREMSKDLKSKGFKFVGATICYAYMQATGMVNDHLTGCFRHAQLKHR